jgi:hypothetical protein
MKNKWDEFYAKHGRFYLLTHPDLKKVIEIFKQNSQTKILDIGLR